jgi:hypothetical protein
VPGKAQRVSAQVPGEEEVVKFLLDTNPKDVVRLSDEHPDFVIGQLICPAHSRSNWGGVFAMDNSAFTNFDPERFRRLQQRNIESKDRCLFATCPDIVGNMRRTLELFRHRERFSAGFDLCLVLQNGAEDMDIPWADTPSVFIGGIDPWKESAACRDLIKTAKAFGLHVHCGRVNQIGRFEYMADLGVDTCDGSGASRFGFHQLLQIIGETNGRQQRSLFHEEGDSGAEPVGGAAVEVRD